MKTVKILPIFFLTSILLLNAYTNSISIRQETSLQSLFAEIAGVYVGNLRNMLQGLDFDRYAGFVVPAGWKSNFRSGTGTTNITDANDSKCSFQR